MKQRESIILYTSHIHKDEHCERLQKEWGFAIGTMHTRSSFVCLFVYSNVQSLNDCMTQGCLFLTLGLHHSPRDIENCMFSNGERAPLVFLFFFFFKLTWQSWAAPLPAPPLGGWVVSALLGGKTSHPNTCHWPTSSPPDRPHLPYTLLQKAITRSLLFSSLFFSQFPIFSHCTDSQFIYMRTSVLLMWKRSDSAYSRISRKGTCRTAGTIQRFIYSTIIWWISLGVHGCVCPGDIQKRERLFPIENGSPAGEPDRN